MTVAHVRGVPHLQISEWSFHVGAWANSPALLRRFISFRSQLNRVSTFAVDGCFYCWVARRSNCAAEVGCSPDVNGSVINIIINERRIEKEEVHDT